MEVECDVKRRSYTAESDSDEHIPEVPSHEDEADEEEGTLDQTGFLLARLQELKAWQAEQEQRLIDEQRKEMSKIQRKATIVQAQGEDTDDATLDNEISSLNSYEEAPERLDSKSSSEASDDDEDIVAGHRYRPENAIPSWATRGIENSNSDESFSGKHTTVLQTKQQQHQRSSVSSADSRLLEYESRPINKANTEKKGTSLDDQPVGGAAKTFEELLAAELGTDAVPNEDDNAAFTRREISENKPKSFLRKGSGLSRFRGYGSPPAKGFKRSKSLRDVSKVANTSIKSGNASTIKSSKSCSKLNIAERETVSFANKKMSPKRATKKPSAKVNTNKSVIRDSTAKRIASSVSAEPSPPHPPPKRAIMTPAKPTLTAMMPAQIENWDDNSEVSPTYDSVEWSFREKLKKADRTHKRELEDLAAFERLEEAACDSSFCSSSSRVKHLLHDESNSNKCEAPAATITSTPIGPGRPNLASLDNLDHNGDNDTSLSLGPSLMSDIQRFLAQNKPRNEPLERSKDESDEDDTLKEELKNAQSAYNMNDYSFNAAENEEVDTASVGRVNFNDKDNKDRAMDFSPPRISKNSPSYLIWNIFTKEREEQRKKAVAALNASAGKGKAKSVMDKPVHKLDNGASLSDLVSMTSDGPFGATLLNAKLAELEKQIELFRKENTNITSTRRKLAAEKKKLMEEVAAFEKSRETEKKHLEEDKRRLRRDRILLEKREKSVSRSSLDKKATEENDELKEKVSNLQEELIRKEAKWTSSISKLQEQVKHLERENQHLHEENYRLKVKGINAKVSSHLVDPSTKAVLLSSRSSTGSASSATTSMTTTTTTTTNSSRKNSTPDSGIRSTATESHNSNTNTPTASATTATSSTPLDVPTPRMMFSPANSLDSQMTLVSGVGDMDNNKPAAVPREKTHADGSVEVIYSNGNRKLVSSDGRMVKVYYYNGDIKQNLTSGLVKYFYAETKTWHLTYPDRKEVLQFNNGQEEIRYPDDSIQIIFPDGSVKKIASDGSEEMTFPDGTKLRVLTNGDRILQLPNGQREVHTSKDKRREYPDGTVKILYNDSSQETRYANGRVRKRDPNGQLVYDSHAPSSTTDKVQPQPSR